MLSENKIIFENIKTFRHLINEQVSDSNIINAINNHEWVYLYYGGDENTKRGYRTVRPYVLGTHKSNGKSVLRAWQDNPKNSFHFDNKPTRKDSKFHDYWVDGEGSKPGWRMFRVDKILQIYPTGKKFHDSNGLVMIPAGYHEGADKDMSSIVAYISTKKEPDFEYEYDKEFYGDEKSKKEISKEKWDSIRRGNKNRKKITAQDVTKLRDIASNVFKKAHGNFLVVIDDKNNYHLIRVDDKTKKNIPDTAIVGSLPKLYDELVKKDQHDDRFFKNSLNQALNERNEKEMKRFPHNVRTFFKI